MHQNITESLTRSFEKNLSVIKSFVAVKVDEFKKIREEFIKKEKQLDKDRENWEKNKEE
jgi:hypothetical protein